MTIGHEHNIVVPLGRTFPLPLIRGHRREARVILPASGCGNRGYGRRATNACGVDEAQDLRADRQVEDGRVNSQLHPLVGEAEDVAAAGYGAATLLDHPAFEPFVRHVL